MTETDHTLSRLIISLMKGVIYHESEAHLWQSLLDLQGRVTDYVKVLGLDLVLDESEGYAYLKQRIAEEEELEIPRLIARRQLGFTVSLLLALLREKLLESDVKGGEIRLILSRDQIMDMALLFLPDSANQVKLIDKLDGHIDKIVHLGFLRRLPGQEDQFEVRRILKAFINAQWLGEFESRLAQYQAYINSSEASQDESG